MTTKSRKKKGISSVFIVIYLAIILLVLGASLFSAIQLSSSSSIERAKIEKDKNSEAILVQIGAITLRDDYIETIRVNNTGSINLRIRAIYIDSKMIFDPSAEPNQQTYINPQESIQITIWGHQFISFSDYKFSTLKITTERGTVFEVVLASIFPETSGQGNIDTIYGPIRLIFEEFYWTNFYPDFDVTYVGSAGSPGSATWYDGWSTPPNQQVIWKIVVQNVDSQILTLDKKCSLVLISNKGGNRYVYYLDPTTTDLILKPSEYGAIFFVWKQVDPAARTGSSASSTPQDRSCMTFLVMEGKIGDRPLGETIPFEAVLVDDTPIVKIDSNPSGLDPTFIKVDGFGIGTPRSFTWAPGTIHTISAVPSADLGNARYTFISWSDGGAATHNVFAPDVSTTYTANYAVEYYVTFDQSGVGDDASAATSFLTVGTSTYTQNQLPQSIWLADGTTYSYSGTISATSGKQYALTDVTGLVTSPIHSPGLVTGNYETQWQVTFTQNGLGNDATGAVLTIGANTYGYAQIPLTVWVDDGESYAYTRYISCSSTGKQYVYTGSSGEVVSPIHGSGSINANYKTQFYVTVTADFGTCSPSTGAWYDPGAVIPIAVFDYYTHTFQQWKADTNSIAISNKNLPSTTATINGAGIVNAEFNK